MPKVANACFLVEVHDFKWNSNTFSEKQYFSGNTAFDLKMWFGAGMEQNTYHIPLVFQYFPQGALEIYSPAGNIDFVENQIFT